MAEVKLTNSERKMADLTTLVSRLEQDLHQERADQTETRVMLARAESCVAELSKTLDDSESLRNSLALQATHLEQDLHNAKTELEESEGRYHVLQQQQLAAMSAHEATKALRKQIEELESRVLRRTEQIGVHQHDIKKLEMNLRLQEERVTELTGDVDVLETEKLAMVEDCRTTREERDTALRRCEALEENVEMLEAQAVATEEHRSTELQAMVRTVFDSVSKRRPISRALRIAESRFAAQEQLFAVQLHQVEEAASLSRLEVQRFTREQNSALYTQSQQATLALATVYAGLRKTNASLDLVCGARTSLHAQLDAVRQDLEQKLNELSDLHAHREDAAAEASETEKRHAERIHELEERCKTLRNGNTDLKTQHEQTLAELTATQDQVRLQMSESTGRVQEEGALRVQLEAMQRRYQDETDALRAELSKTIEELETAQLKQSELESAHRQTLDDVSAEKEELQERLTETLEKLVASEKAVVELGDTEARHIAEIDTLTERLDTTEKDVDELTKARDELLAEHGTTSKEFDEKRTEVEVLQRAKEDLEMQLENVQTVHQAEMKILQERVELAARERAELQSSLADVEVRFDELNKVRDELEEQLAAADTDVERLRVELKAESEQRLREAEQHAEELRTVREHGDRASLGHGELQQELASFGEQLQQADAAIQAAGKEKLELQTQMTELEAEIQRGLSFQRHLESQIQDGHKQTATLKEQVDKTRADYIRAEKEAKTAEINLSLQAVQHEKIVSGLRNEIETLQETSKLAEAVEELREQNQEMENLLKAKCLEIEENDDRFIGLIKEKKKLTSKVESLTRKIKSLQEKLSSVSQDTTPKANPLPATSTSAAPVASTSTLPPLLSPPTRALPPLPPMVEMPEMSAHPFAPQFQLGSSTSSHPVHEPFLPSQSSSFRPLQDAFQPQQDHLRASASTSSTVGVKRRAPNDFEDCDGVPAQVFTVDSVPSSSDPMGQTPRVRRALQNVRGGFTPMRHTRASTQPQPSSHLSPSLTPSSEMPVATPAQPGSPPRQKSSAAIADVTNSPRSKAAQKGKRKWLDALRGGSTQATRGGATVRPGFDRAQNAAR
ncbi:uncharacterized protein PHACADRAFT_84405 [Phanerochaete carnosa HHB-10118-sp]|uniref:Uncharacterized protein n=1 Tax=Phanerochaete carnosa (strain HHB-10118-sp) TaxID=650164 RepID=K5WQ74_PHACS|nr:uncharacterized protein PHACADRAFT_84405 [Phanerochaete carnosa HHB-10118-sp]EKM61630.1 hypothetical protein PHACADRAFT_84405 [Phanerochaete carnosa HHB-10118-sp]